jgi:hypothetical protein
MSARGLPVSSASRELVVVRVHAGAVSEPDLSFSAPRSTIDKEEQRQAETILLPDTFGRLVGRERRLNRGPVNGYLIRQHYEL